MRLLSEETSAVSGQRLAMRLGKSRCCIWKAVESLRKDGYEIEAATNRGYRLIKGPDKLCADEISRITGTEVIVFDSVTSTNTIAKERAAEGVPHGYTVIAAHQTKGRGRRGHSFESVGDGIYLSTVLRPGEDYSHAPLITAAAAVAVHDSINEICARSCAIKWVNDLFLDGRKICGILTEAVTDMESGAIDSIVVGIGINFSGKIQELPEEIRDIVGFIYTDKSPRVTRNALAAAIIRHLLMYADNPEEKRFLKTYRQNCNILGQRIEFRRGNTTVAATALDIDDTCGLKVLTDEGEELTLHAGEISVKKKESRE